MTWLMWRQHRSEALALALLITALGGVLLILGLPMHATYRETIVDCLVPPFPDTCAGARMRFQQDYGYNTTILTLFNVVPLVIGGFLGAPLLARELETGTLQLAWTQAVPRMRWLAVKLTGLAALTVGLSFAFTALITWYRRPLDVLYGPFTPDGFDVEGLAAPAYALFAFALATAAGTLLRRTLPALALAMVVFVITRVTVSGWLRPRYQTPSTLLEEIPANTRGIQIGTDNRTDWTLGQGYADADGHPLARTDINALDRSARDAGMSLNAYVHDQGIQRWVTYHPASRFWTFQYIEAGIFAGLAAALIALVVWRVKRRTV